MKQEDLDYGVYRPFDKPNPPHIVRRLGAKPSHVNCSCPGSWKLVVKPSSADQNNQFAVEVEPQALNAEERDDLTSQVKRIDGSGGLAPYENFGIVKSRADLARSIAAACMQSGVIILPNGDVQPPLFVIPNDMPPIRWYIDDFDDLVRN